MKEKAYLGGVELASRVFKGGVIVENSNKITLNLNSFNSDDYVHIIKTNNIDRITFNGDMEDIFLTNLIGIDIVVNNIKCKKLTIKKCFYCNLTIIGSDLSKLEVGACYFSDATMNFNKINNFRLLNVSSYGYFGFSSNKVNGIVNNCMFKKFGFSHNVSKLGFAKTYFLNSNIKYNEFNDPIFDSDNENLKYQEIESVFNNCDFNLISFEENKFNDEFITSFNDKKIFLSCVGVGSKLPEEGSFVGWKVLTNEERSEFLLCKLLILDDSKRVGGYNYKFRCEKAKVLSIENLNGDKFDYGHSYYFPGFTYTVDNVVESSRGVDENETKECSYGINFFLTKEEAINYIQFIKGD